jgi:hypothetical protein
MMDSVHEAVRVLSRPPHSKNRSRWLAAIQQVELELRDNPHPKSGHWKMLFAEFGTPEAVAKASNAIHDVEKFEESGTLPNRHG